MKQKAFTEGFTLIELLVAIALLALLMALAFSSMTQGIKMQSSTETQVNFDANLRRITQIITQDLRNASYAMISAIPYDSSSSAVSVALAVDNAVHPVTGPPASFQTAQNTQALLPASTTWPINSHFALVNPTREQATILKLSTALVAGGAISLSHSGQTNTICPSSTNFVQRVALIGYSYDARKKIIFRKTQDNTGDVESPLAFNISEFILSYISTSGESYLSLGDIPAGEQLSRIGISISMSKAGSSISRTLKSSVEIPKLFTLSTRPIRYIAPGTTTTCS